MRSTSPQPSESMAFQGESHANLFSIIVRESRDSSAGSTEERNNKRSAVKYAKTVNSANSIMSRDSNGDIMEVKVTEAKESLTMSGSGEGEGTGTGSLEDSRAEDPEIHPHSQLQVWPPEDATDSGCASYRTEVLESDLNVLRNQKRDKKFKHRKHSLWYRLRRRHKHMGVVEVNSGHLFYHRLKAISAGLQHIFSHSQRPFPVDKLTSEHYNDVIRNEITLPGNDVPPKQASFVFESYAPAVFATIRRAVSVEEEDYLNAIISPHNAYLEFISNSRSGQDFFLTHNMHYLIKTNKERDVKFLLSIIGEYLQHFLSFPHSLLVKYLGCYSIKYPAKKKMYFLMMQNIFYPPDRIEDRFDVKGCTAGRYQEPDPPGSHTITVLKDQNFFQEELQLGSNRQWFIDQLSADSRFLKNLNVMDYSLLVGRQKLSAKERMQTLPNIVTRITKLWRRRTIFIRCSARCLCLPRSNQKLVDPCVVDSQKASPDQQSAGQRRSPEGSAQPRSPSLPGAVEMDLVAMAEAVVQPHRSCGLHFPHSLARGMGPLGNQRRRLLPDSYNALHIVDGPEYRYFFGIVDFLTRWTFRQKTARLWKVVKYGCGEHSTMPPNYYSMRFINFLSNRVS